MPNQTGSSDSSLNGLASSLTMLANLIHERTGLNFEANRLETLADKLAPLLSEGNFDTYLDYYYFLRYDEHSGNAWQRLQTALAVNETYFWREYDQIRATAEWIVPRLQKQNAVHLPRRPVRIWHAACATGEEPYTMAIALQEAGAYERGTVEIIATDFNVDALSQARLGIYRQRSFRSIPPEILTRYFTPHGRDQNRLVDSIRARVNFSYMNLLDETAMARMRDFDVIICRNAFIYFSNQSVNRVVEAFYRSLIDTGFLFVAAAESLLRLTNLFELVEVAGAFGYKKRLGEDANENRASGTLTPWIYKPSLDDRDSAQINPPDHPGDI